MRFASAGQGSTVATLAAMAARVASVRGVVKTFASGGAGRRVLDGVDLDVHSGELVAVAGRSGSGKSTLLHLLGGLDRPDSGSIEVGGTRVDLETEQGLTRLRRAQVGFVFQSFHLLPELTGLENVLLPARLAGDGRVATRKARALISRLGLDEAASRLPTSLSGGEQQRLAIVRALVTTRCSCSRTSRPGTSTSTPACRSCSCCARLQTAAAESCSSRTTVRPPPLPIEC